jgi:hypothetical protein
VAVNIRQAWLACALALMGVGCDEPSAHDRAVSTAMQALQGGRDGWAKREPDCGAYYYDRESVMSHGAANITTVQIVAGAPAWRSYVPLTRGLDPRAAEDSWVEEGPDVGSHASGAPALTIEQLYDQCETLVEHAQATRYVVTIEDSVPKLCQWIEGQCEGTLCLDDQFQLTGFACGTIAPQPVRGGGSPPDAGAD